MGLQDIFHILTKGRAQLLSRPEAQQIGKEKITKAHLHEFLKKKPKVTSWFAKQGCP